MNGRSGFAASLFPAYLLVLAWLPVPLGSNRAWSTAWMAVLVMLLLVAWAMTWLRGACTPQRALARSAVFLWPLLLWLAYLLLQCLPLPLAWIAWLSPATAELWTYSFPTDTAAWYPLSLDRGAGLMYFLRASACVGLLFLTLVLVNSRTRLRLTVQVLVLVGFVEAVVGTGLHLAGKTLFVPELLAPRVTGATGTYVNANHFAGLLEITIGLGLGLIYTRLHGIPAAHRPANWRFRLQQLSGFALEPLALQLFMLLCMIAALLFSGSRGGVAALLVSAGGWILLGMQRRGIHSRDARLGVWGLLLAVLAVLWLGAGVLESKLERSGFSSNREEIRASIYPMLQDRPWFGSGAGTFAVTFPLYQSAQLGSYHYDHAHNDYLEVLVEQGRVGFALLGLAVTGFGWMTLRGFRQRRNPESRGLALGAGIACTSLLLHGWVDFNLQIPANAAYFCVLMGIGAVASMPDQPSRSMRT